jgi:hypothetical protein
MRLRPRDKVASLSLLELAVEIAEEGKQPTLDEAAKNTSKTEKPKEKAPAEPASKK